MLTKSLAHTILVALIKLTSVTESLQLQAMSVMLPTDCWGGTVMVAALEAADSQTQVGAIRGHGRSHGLLLKAEHLFICVRCLFTM